VQPTKIGQCGGAVLVGAVVVGAVLVGAVLVGAVVVGAVVCPTSAVADKQKVPIASRFLMVTFSYSIFFKSILTLLARLLGVRVIPYREVFLRRPA
jgi:hypothetical protein